ncbi:MAG: hypothetical protein M1817_000354, partial [Caeruleum heppii]
MESHSDDITELRFHPSQTALLISGSTDGLVNLYDTALQDEEDALLQTINHGSSIHRAGFLGDSEVFALGHDETLSLHQLTRPPDDIEVQSSTVMGDVREMLSCEYVVDVLDRGIEGAVLATGRHDEGQLDLIPLKRQTQWCFDTAAKTRLPAAHSGEVVRSIYIDE